MELMLGTVQFGLDYGVSNAAGQVGEEEVEQILATAAREGVRLIDTARAYGEAEAVLGRILEPGHPFRIVTKLPPGTTPKNLLSHLDASMDALDAVELDALLLHSVEDWTHVLAVMLEGLRDGRRIDRIGVSVYDPMDAVRIAEHYDLDLVQLPLNVFDQRALTGGALDALSARGVAVHVRSTFLQGLLLMEQAPFAAAAAPLRAWQAAVDERGVDPLTLALSFAKGLPVEAVVVGVTSVRELEEILAAWDGEPADPGDFAALAQTDLSLLDPSRWVTA